MPTFAEAIVAELAHSGVLERMRPWVDAQLKPWVEWWTVETPKTWLGMFSMARAIGERAEQNFPSKAYRPYFEAQGVPPFLARGLGSLALSGGKRQAKEAKRVAPVIEAIRFLAQADRQRRAILSRAKVALAAANETSIVDELFSNAGLHEGEYSLRRMHPSGSRAGTLGANTKVISSTTRLKPLGRNLATLTLPPGLPVAGSNGGEDRLVPFTDSISDILLLGSCSRMT